MILMYGQRLIFAWHEAGINPVLKLVQGQYIVYTQEAGIALIIAA
jgi:hypothetical protein